MSEPRPDLSPDPSQETQAFNLPLGVQFAAGQLLAERFRIVRFLARGGMGEVYQAEDLELREVIALKMVRSEIALNPTALERFRREIQLARRITHPNVCRLFDLFHHSSAESVTSSTPGSKVLFVTMELLNGQTLTDRLQQSGAMTPDEALPIIAQMAAGLEAAHEVGIIHQDFKSSNIILVPSEPGTRGRAVITDFGLARRFSQSSDATESMAIGSGICGTPAYMAPEQVQGRELTAAADIYSLGVVMYEMLTGNLPFTGDTPLVLAAKRLHEDPVSPFVHRPDLDKRWASTILACLERDPARRFSKASDVVAELSGTTSTTARIPGKQPSDRHLLKTATVTLPLSRFLLLSAIVIIGVLAGVYLFTGMGSEGFRRSVAVLGFRNLTGDAGTEWLSHAFSDMLTTELAAGEKLRTISGENVVGLKAGLSFQSVDAHFAGDILSRIRNQLGSDVIIYGSYAVVAGRTGPRIRLDLRVQDTKSGEMLSELTDEGDMTELLDIVARTGSKLRKELGVAPLSDSELDGLKATRPSTREAVKAYAEGLSQLRLSDGLQARHYLEQAVAADSRFALARSALATAWLMSGYSREAKAEAQRAVDLSERLPREERLLVQARYHEAAGQWDRAAESYRTLFGFFPDNLDYGLRLAGARVSAGQAAEAYVVIDALRKLPRPDGDNPRIDLAEARAAGALGDYNRQRSAAATAVAKAEAQGANLLVAGGLLLEGIALSNLGNMRAAATAFEKARFQYHQAGDHWGVANAMHNLGVTLAKTGDLREANKRYEETLPLYRDLGDRTGEAAALVSLANVQRTLGNLSIAQKLHEQALSIYREIGNRAKEARALNDLGNVLASEGQAEAATKMYEEALTVFREVGDKHAVATIFSNLAGVRFDQGDFAQASSFYEQSRALFVDLGAQGSLAFVLSRIGDLLVSKGDIAGGRLSHEQALAIRERLGEKGNVADNQLALAQIALDEGTPTTAETLARASAEQFHNQGRLDDEVIARTVVARTLLRQAKVDEAGEAIGAMQKLHDESTSPVARISLKTTGALIQAARGNTRAATALLRDAIVDARRNALTGLEFEARLALGQVEVAAGHAGGNQLAALEKEAASKGYARIAQRASEARRRAVSGAPVGQR